MNKYSFTVIQPHKIDWENVESCVDCTIFHTQEWINYLEHTGRRTIIIGISKYNIQGGIGYFIGSKHGIIFPFIGSPDGGTGTYVQGLCLKERISIEERLSIYKELAKYIFKHRLAVYLQISDWEIKTLSNDWNDNSATCFPILDDIGLHYKMRSTFFVNVTKPIEELWHDLYYKSCKYSINKAIKLGLYSRIIETKEDIPAFVEKLSSQVLDVSRRKRERRHLHHSRRYLLNLCTSLFPDKILMIQIIGKNESGEETVMSSAIFCLGKSASTYFAGASHERYMKYCPNELMVWTGIKILHERGAGDMIMGGIASYKRKFGSIFAYLPMIIFSRYRILYNGRSIAKSVYNKLRIFLR